MLDVTVGGWPNKIKERLAFMLNDPGTCIHLYCLLEAALSWSGLFQSFSFSVELLQLGSPRHGKFTVPRYLLPLM